MDEEQIYLFDAPTYKPINIDDEMRNSYLEYAMSVIVGRALPDVRDGLKPVHRRILFAMHDAGYTAGRAYKKSARIVGDVLGRYHPHGDTAVYDSMVRMAQDFSVRYPLIDGQGNYGSVDGDNAAAMRYTEARLTRLAMALLEDIEKDTVNFTPNFDESLQEPKVLPSKLPMLLLNGSSGIAVGMATNIPPHNLGEVVDGICALIDNPEIEIDELMHYIKGPDFPTGATICGTQGIQSAYHTGRGSVLLRAKSHLEESAKKGKQAIIVTEIPYMVNKANLIVKIAELVGDKKITGIADLRDESDRKGMRIYIELKRDASYDVVLNQLYKHTQLQNTFGINVVAIVNGIPRTLDLKSILVHYLDHRKTVITRRTQFDLSKSQDRLHILEGLRIALEHIDAIIVLIRGSADVDTARMGLIGTYGLSERQANAILEMRLQRLTGLERDKVESEYATLLSTIQDLEDILANEPRIFQIIKTEHLELKDKFADARRSIIGDAVGYVDYEDLIPVEQVAVMISRKGFIKRMPIAAFKSQQRGGRGVNGMTTRDEDVVDDVIVTSTHHYLLCFTTAGKVCKIKAHQIPETGRQSKGVSVAHFLQLGEGEGITAVLPVENFDQESNVLMTTRKGIVKKTDLAAFRHFKNRPIIAIDLDPDDQLQWVRPTSGTQEVVLVTSAGMVIRFKESDIRESGRTSRGVRGIKIKPEDTLVAMDVIDPTESNVYVLVLTKAGYGKNMLIREFKTQLRGGIGVRCMRFRKSVGGDRVSDAVVARRAQECLIVTQKGTLCRQKVANISTQRRESQGVRIIKLDSDDVVIAMSVVDESDD